MSDREYDPVPLKIVDTLRCVTTADRATLLHAAGLLERECENHPYYTGAWVREEVLWLRVDLNVTAAALREMADG